MIKVYFSTVKILAQRPTDISAVAIVLMLIKIFRVCVCVCVCGGGGGNDKKSINEYNIYMHHKKRERLKWKRKTDKQTQRR